MFSQITLVGHVGAVPETSFLPSGGQVSRFRLAVNETWKKDGERQQRTDWYTIVMFQTRETGLITSVVPLIKKGMPVMVVGSPQQRQWTAQDGSSRTTFEVRIGPNDVIRLLGQRPQNGHDEETGATPPAMRNGVEEPPPLEEPPFGN